MEEDPGLGAAPSRARLVPSSWSARSRSDMSLELARFSASRWRSELLADDDSVPLSVAARSSASPTLLSGREVVGGEKREVRVSHTYSMARLPSTRTTDVRSIIASTTWRSIAKSSALEKPRREALRRARSRKLTMHGRSMVAAALSTSMWSCMWLKRDEARNASPAAGVQ